VFVCAAWALGQTLSWGLALGTIGIVIPAALAVGVLVITEDLGRRRESGDVKYWRGRRLDDEERRGRWN
jgi:hypothetical protein